jgi:hypothetical protein
MSSSASGVQAQADCLEARLLVVEDEPTILELLSGSLRFAQKLPLAGSPRLTLLGREMGLGAGYADLIAVESSGRLVIIEVKLAVTAESRRAVVVQVLSYAGYLQGLNPEQLESQLLAKHLPAGCQSRMSVPITRGPLTRGLSIRVIWIRRRKRRPAWG